MSGRRKKPPLSAEDVHLWRRVTEGITPLNPQKPDPVEAPAKKRLSPKKVKPLPPSFSAPSYTPPQSKPAIAYPERIEHKLFRKIGRDQGRIDDVLDLHGMRQHEAHISLDRFIRASAARGHRLVMVITGKGSKTGGAGVLRKSVPQWLAMPAIAPYVVGFANAHRHRGGDGALYIQLRRIDRVKT